MSELADLHNRSKNLTAAIAWAKQGGYPLPLSIEDFELLRLNDLPTLHHVNIPTTWKGFKVFYRIKLDQVKVDARFFSELIGKRGNSAAFIDANTSELVFVFPSYRDCKLFNRATSFRWFGADYASLN